MDFGKILFGERQRLPIRSKAEPTRTAKDLIFLIRSVRYRAELTITITGI